jgi:hypothetical protein
MMMVLMMMMNDEYEYEEEYDDKVGITRERQKKFFCIYNIYSHDSYVV